MWFLARVGENYGRTKLVPEFLTMHSTWKYCESPLDCKETKPVNPKGNQSCIFTGRTDAEAETLILWPRDAKNWFTRKDPDAGNDWRQEEKGTIEDEMVGWHHRLNGHEFEQTLGTGDGQGSLACCSPWGCKESDMTEQLNWLNWSSSRLQRLQIFSFGPLSPAESPTQDLRRSVLTWFLSISLY